MGPAVTATALSIGIGIIMFGLGLSLTVADFARVARHPRALVVALACQLVLLPAICFGLVLLFRLPPVLAVGMMLLAASPGGTTANLFSHLFRGDVALSIALTAVNSVAAIVTLPVVTNVAIGWFAPELGALGTQWAMMREVFVLVLVPVALGVLVRRILPAFAAAMDRPVRIVSVVVIVVVVAGVVAANWTLLLANFERLAFIAILFCVLSLSIGFLVPRLLRVGRRQAIATSFEVGIHNAALAIVIAQNVLGSTELSLPAAVYGIIMFFLAFGFGWLLRRRVKAEQASTASGETGLA